MKTLSDYFSELADTMPPTVDRAGAVRARVSRRRRRRQGARVAAAVTGLLAIGLVSWNQVSSDSPVRAAGPASPTSASVTTASSVAAAPDCATVPRAAPSDIIVANHVVKGVGVISAVSADSISLNTVEGTAPKSFVLSVNSSTTFTTWGMVVAARPALAVGQTVGFSATDTGVLQILESDPVDIPVDAPLKNAIDLSKPPLADAVKGDGTVVAANATAVTLNVTSGPLAGQTVRMAVTNKTVIAKSGQTCTLGTVGPGTHAFFVTSGSESARSLDVLLLN